MTGVDTNRGTWILAVAAVLFAVLILPQVVEDDGGDKTVSVVAVPSALPSQTPSGLPTSGSTALPTRTVAPSARGTGGSAGDTGDTGYRPPSPIPNPTAEAFAAVRPGDCLNLYHTGTDWNMRLPQTVSCASESAFLRVSGVNVGCPSGSGRTDWSYGRTTLCLERQFRRGQCFLVDKTGGSDSHPVFDAKLLTWVDCDARRIPVAYDSILVISDVYRAPKTVPRGVCSRGAYDRTVYWYWISNGNSTLVCATYPEN